MGKITKEEEKLFAEMKQLKKADRTGCTFDRADEKKSV